jgi:asparagine synthase (glutamine-hydrolysing)
VRRAVIGTLSHYPLTSPSLLQLSGGLDSSILAAALSAAGRPRSAVTFATRSAEGDERRYAQAVARRTGTPLAERLLEEGPLSFEPATSSGFRPGRNPLLDPLQQAVEDHAHALGASEIIDGAGGDNVFCALGTIAPALDAWRWRGPAAAWSTMADLAKLGDATLWRAARLTFARARRSPHPIWRQDASLLNPGAVVPRPNFHPWLEAPPGALPGKFEHVRALVHIQHFLDRRSSPDLPAVHPLMAQPILETCLRVPTWLWVAGGRDRAVARLAFSDLLPPEIVARRSKGSLQGLFVRRFRQSRAGLRDLLLGGGLAQRQVIDRAAIENALVQDPPSDHDIIRLTEMAALETWLRAVP